MVHPPNTQKNAKVENFKDVKSDSRPSFWRYLACFIILPLKNLRKLRKLVARANCLRTLEEFPASNSLEVESLFATKTNRAFASVSVRRRSASNRSLMKRDGLKL